VARAAVPGRLTRSWLVATVSETRGETETARTLTLDVPGWEGHLAGMHVTARLTAEDGYSAQRDYSIASAPAEGRFAITVQHVQDGEVSSYLSGPASPASPARPGDQFEVRGPIGGWFTWTPDNPSPVLLLAGGSGIVPLMSMIRTHGQAKSRAPLQLIYSARTPADVIYAKELSERVRMSPATVATLLYSRLTRYRGTPAEATEKAKVTDVKIKLPGYAGRLSAEVLAQTAFPPELAPAIYACGPNGFVETAATLLTEAGYKASTIKTERFG
jgi:ferredoxin-NADP reductase